MSKKRTKKQKEKAALVRTQVQVPREPSDGASDSYNYQFSGKKTPNSVALNDGILRIEKKYILADLRKTIIITLFLVFVLIGIYFYLSYN